VSEVLKTLEERFGDRVLSTHCRLDEPTAVLQRDAVKPALRWLRDECRDRYDFLADLGGVDGMFLEDYPERFEVVYQLLSTRSGRRLRIRASVPEEDPEVETVTDLWRSADWSEREVWDMFGVRFRGHPNLRRILCIENFEGHALRKDYDIRRQQWVDEDAPDPLEEAPAQRSAFQGLTGASKLGL